MYTGNDKRTAGTVEAWNFMLKRTDHIKQLRMRPDLFIKNHLSVLLGRQFSYIDDVQPRDKDHLKVRNNERTKIIT